MPSLHLYILTIILFQDLYAQPISIQKWKEISKEFSFSSYSSIFTLDHVKKNFKKDNQKPMSRSQKVFKGSAWCICFIFSWPKKVVEVHSRNLSFQRLWRNQLLKLPNEGVLSNISIFKVCILKKLWCK